MENKTLKEILAGDVYEEEFSTAFHAMLTKLVKEFDDMGYMRVIKDAGTLLDTINNI